MGFYTSMPVGYDNQTITLRFTSHANSQADSLLDKDSFKVLIRRDDGRAQYYNTDTVVSTNYKGWCGNKCLSRATKDCGCKKKNWKELVVTSYNNVSKTLVFSLSEMFEYMEKGRYILQVQINCETVEHFYIDWMPVGRGFEISASTTGDQATVPVEDCKEDCVPCFPCDVQYDESPSESDYEIVPRLEYKRKKNRKPADREIKLLTEI